MGTHPKVVVDVMRSPSSAAYVGEEGCSNRRDEEFHQAVTLLENN